MAKDDNGRAGRAVNEARDRAESGVDSAKDAMDGVRESAAEAWDDTKTKVRRGAKRVREYTEENPWHAVAISAGIGFVLGSLLARRRD